MRRELKGSQDCGQGDLAGRIPHNRAPSNTSLASQGFHRVDLSGAAPRRPAGQQCHGREQQSNAEQRRWIRRSDPEQEGSQNAHQNQGNESARDHAAGDQPESLGEIAVRMASSRRREATESESTP
jgi:hypothetical protein